MFTAQKSSIKQTFARSTSESCRWGLVVALAILATAAPSFAAVYPGYSFLPVTTSTGTGNTTFTQFTGTQGVITVTHSFSAGGAGTADNQNFLAGFHPADFTNTFPGAGNNMIQGHLAQTVYNHTSQVEFDMQGYSITPNTVFGIWNTTDEVTAPVGGNPVYRVQLLIANTLTNPTMLSYMGNQDNQAQVQGRHSLVMNLSNGEITPGGTINGGVGTHTDAAFWRRIPATTQKIIVFGDLPPLNNIGDGVGYYFAELVPEPSSLSLLMIGLFSVRAIFGRRQRNTT